MAVCEWCGRRVPDELEYCPGCGKSFAAPLPVATPKKLFAPVDPVYVICFVLAASSVAFSWIQRVNVVLAGSALLVAILAYHRHNTSRKGYGGYWLVWLGTLVAVYGMAAGIRVMLKI